MCDGDGLDLVDVLQKESEPESAWGQEERIVSSEMIQGLMKCFDEAGLL